MSSVYKALSKQGQKKTEKERHINRQKVLLISSRGVTYRHRHVINDLSLLLPHSKRQAKIGSKKNLYDLNEVAELYNCNNIVYFETKKHQDLYMWVAKTPNGPSMKFFVQNMSTLEELNFTGNCLRGLRPILSFDKAFESSPHLQLSKEMLTQSFGVPPQSRKNKPFIDHVTSFSVVDDKIWIRNYQINEGGEDEELSLIEIGPRLVLTPVVVLEGSFCGPKIYENKQFVSPNVVRAQLKNQQAVAARSRQDGALDRKIKKRDNVLAKDPLANEELFK